MKWSVIYNIILRKEHLTKDGYYKIQILRKEINKNNDQINNNIEEEKEE